MIRPRGIFVKLVGVFLLVGLLPFLGIEYWSYQQAKTPMTEAVIESWLVRLARETAAHVDLTLSELRTAVLLWAEEETLAIHAGRAREGGTDSAAASVTRLTGRLGRRAARLGNVALAMIVAPDGRILAAATDGSKSAASLNGRFISAIARNPAEAEWIRRALKPGADLLAPLDWHRSSFVQALGEPATASDSYQVGFAAPLRKPDSLQTEGAIAVLFQFQAIQHVLDQVQLKFVDEPAGRAHSEPRYPSGYAFLFDTDADTIIGHKERKNFGSSLTRDHNLAQLHKAILARAFGFEHYEYPKGTWKISGFAHTAGVAEGGFGWIVGVGINHDDIYADVRALRDQLAIAALIVAGLVVLVAALLSARITRPLTRLVGFTQSVARGNLDARVSIKSNDEIALLANAFNRMTADLKETNLRLIQAEKDAAWREMARQVAHEIKNPLTPIMLSAQQVERALADRHPDLDAIVRDSVKSIVEQCDSLRQIAQNFASYAAFPKPTLERIAIPDLVDRVVSVYAAHQREGFGVVVAPGIPEGCDVRADVDAMRRVFLNLFNNAFEAMGGEGTITVRATVEASPSGNLALISVSDTGRGIPADDIPHLFEPYFSTRTGGTGLGLAICRKIVTEHDGAISVRSEPGKGTTFTISLPCLRAGDPSSGSDDDSFSETRTLPRG